MIGDDLRVLVVDDDTSILTVLKTLLERQGFEVETAGSSDKAYNILRRDEFDLMLSDIVMQPFDGISLLRQARTINPDTQIIMMTGFASIETATKALKLGAFDYICKPFKIDELHETIKRAVDYIYKLRGGEEGTPRRKVSLVKKHYREIVGNSDAMKAVYAAVDRLSPTTDPVLIEGESGTGKNLVAKALHSSGPRAAGPFCTFNCVTFPEALTDAFLFGYVEMPSDEDGNPTKGLPVVKKGVVETARGGTLLLEEIGALPMGYQEELLQVLNDKVIYRTGSSKAIPVDVRVIADSTGPLRNKVETGEFLADLYKVFDGNRIMMPTLRDRKEDIPSLVNEFVMQYNRESRSKLNWNDRVTSAIEKYTWPGNVRELRNAIYRSGKQCRKDTVQLTDIPVPVRMCYMRDKSSLFGYSDELDLRWRSLKKYIKNKEKDYVEQVLKATKGDKQKAAKMMGMDLDTFYRKYGNKQ